MPRPLWLPLLFAVSLAEAAAKPIPWAAQVLPDCPMWRTNDFWEFQVASKVLKRDWEKKNAVQQAEGVEDFCKRYTYYKDAATMLDRVSASVQAEGDPAEKAARITEAEIDPEILFRVNEVRKYFGEEHKYPKNLQGKLQALIDQRKGFQAQIKARELERRDQPMRQVAQARDAQGLSQQYDGARQGREQAREQERKRVAADHKVRVASDVQDPDAMKAPEPKKKYVPRAEVPERPAPTDPEKDYIKRENEKWLGLGRPLACAWRGCPEDKVQELRQVRDECARKGSTWCANALEYCQSTFGVRKIEYHHSCTGRLLMYELYKH